MENFREEIFANTHSEPEDIALSSSALVTVAETVHRAHERVEICARAFYASLLSVESLDRLETRDSQLGATHPLGTNALCHLYLQFALTLSNESGAATFHAQAYIPTQPAQAIKDSRISHAHEDPGRQEGHFPPARQGAQAGLGKTRFPRIVELLTFCGADTLLRVSACYKRCGIQSYCDCQCARRIESARIESAIESWGRAANRKNVSPRRSAIAARRLRARVQAGAAAFFRVADCVLPAAAGDGAKRDFRAAYRIYREPRSGRRGAAQPDETPSARSGSALRLARASRGGCGHQSEEVFAYHRLRRGSERSAPRFRSHRREARG